MQASHTVFGIGREPSRNGYPFLYPLKCTMILSDLRLPGDEEDHLPEEYEKNNATRLSDDLSDDLLVIGPGF